MSQTVLYGEKMSSASVKSVARPQTVRVRNVALPVEHGGWGLVLEPLVLGLIVAPSLAGAFLSLAALMAFLARHPLKIVSGDRRRGRRFPRTPVAERFVLLYGAIALLSFTAAIITGPTLMLLPLALAAPLAVLQLVYDFMGRSRSLLPELSGSAAMAALASSLALAAGWSMAPALALWALLASRAVPSIFYVRARLRINRGEEVSKGPTLLLHIGGVTLTTALALNGLVPWLAAGALALLLLRASVGLSAEAHEVTAKQVGVREIVFGAVTILSVAVGHFLGL